MVVCNLSFSFRQLLVPKNDKKVGLFNCTQTTLSLTPPPCIVLTVNRTLGWPPISVVSTGHSLGHIVQNVWEVCTGHICTQTTLFLTPPPCIVPKVYDTYGWASISVVSVGHSLGHIVHENCLSVCVVWYTLTQQRDCP